MTTPRLLIVDDDLLTVRLLCELAARYFSEVPVDGTDSPLTALEYAKTTEYSAVLTDLVMPGTDGLQLTAAIHAIQPNVPIIIMTGSPEAVEQSRPGAFALLCKPLDIHAVLKTLQSALDHSHDPDARSGLGQAPESQVGASS